MLPVHLKYRSKSRISKVNVVDIKMKKTIKFYQTVAPVLLCMMYTTTTFGSEHDTNKRYIPKVICDDYIPKVICDDIDKFCEKGSNDKFYKETHYIEPYSPSLDFADKKQNKIEKLSLRSLCMAIEFEADRIVAKQLKVNQIEADRIKQLHDSHLTIESPEKVCIDNESKEVVIMSRSQKETRSLSDMQFKSKTLLPKNFSLDLLLRTKRNELTYWSDRENGRIDIYLSLDGIESDYQCVQEDGQSYAKPKTKDDKLYSLSSTIAFDVSKDQAKTIVALDKDSGLHKLELKNRPSLYEIMK